MKRANLKQPFNQLGSAIWDRLRYSAIPNLQGSFGIHTLASKPAPEHGKPDTYFETSDGRALPVYPDYRWQTKKGWLFYEPLRGLLAAQERDLLKRVETCFLKEAIGTRAILRPLNDAEQILRDVVRRHPEEFISTDADCPPTPVIRPTSKQTADRVAEFRSSRMRLFRRVERLTRQKVPRTGRILEIGFTSGGHSLLAFEEEGLEAHGIDNFYGGTHESPVLPDFVKRSRDSNVQFHHGDITTKTQFPDGHFDVIFSESVLEHVMDLEAGLAEMRRLLRPGGLMIHTYEPFHNPKGGHSPGVLDLPWGHLRVSQEDYIRYVRDLRPHELEVAEMWITEGINCRSQASIQRAFIQSGLELRAWVEIPIGPELSQSARAAHYSDCFEFYPDVQLSDLFTQTVIVVATIPTGLSG